MQEWAGEEEEEAGEERGLPLPPSPVACVLEGEEEEREIHPLLHSSQGHRIASKKEKREGVGIRRIDRHELWSPPPPPPSVAAQVADGWCRLLSPLNTGWRPQVTIPNWRMMIPQQPDLTNGRRLVANLNFGAPCQDASFWWCPVVQTQAPAGFSASLWW